MAPSAEAHRGSQYGEVMPIAVVGMGFRGPGEATNVERFWKLIAEGREAWSPVPKEKWNNEAFYHPDSSRNGASNVTGGHYLTEDLSHFDAPFFNMTNAEAEALDPQQRLLLECSYEALENSGASLGCASGTNTSVFVGSFCGDFTDSLMRDPENVPLYQATSSGHSRAILANRLSYFFDFKGPSATIDTACSSSLVALHMGCQSIRAGECRQSLVAGANVILSHEMTISMSMMRFLSPDGRCYTFDDRASGYGRGEGVGCVLLKPLHDAVRDGDTIRAIIRNTGMNQDGRTAGITLPNRTAQESLIDEVYRKAGLDPLDTSFVECHGTGTPAGDPLETAAISKVFCQDRSPENPLQIGSVKTNIGHLEGASGVASVIKTVLMLENDVILPNRNFRHPNPQIPLEDWKLKVPTVIEKWGTDRQSPRRVSINSFGYGGTNAHAVLESACGYPQSCGISKGGSNQYTKLPVTVGGRSKTNGTFSGLSIIIPTQNGISNGLTRDSSNRSIAHNTTNSINDHADGSAGYETNGIDKLEFANIKSSQQVFILSAFDEASGSSQAENLRQYIQDRLDLATDDFLADLAYTLGSRRSRLCWKYAVRAGSAEDLMRKLRDPAPRFRRSTTEPGIAFLFTGQGAQWFAMGRELIGAYPSFTDSLIKARDFLKTVGSDWDLIDQLCKDEADSRLGHASLSQPLCTAIQIALVNLLASWGIRPSAVTGHSSGEIAAAYTAGALTFNDAMAVAYYRGVVSAKLSRSGGVPGAMLAAGMSKEAALPLLSSFEYGKVNLACVNSPSSITVSGDAPAITKFELIVREKGIFARRLAVDIAYHSHHMRTIANEYMDAISYIKPVISPSEECVEFFSSITGQKAHPMDLGPSYWVANMTGEVKFAEALLQLCLEATGGKNRRRRGPSCAIQSLVEIGPHAALAGPVKQIIQCNSTLNASSITYLNTLTRKKNAIDTTLDLVANLLVAGTSVDLDACNRLAHIGSSNVLVDLPPYPFKHEVSHWAESRISKTYRNRQYPRTDILGAQDTTANPSEPRWRNIIRTSEIPWLKDHKVQNNVVYPAAGYLVMAIEAAHQRATNRAVNIRGYVLREVTIGQALVVPEKDGDIDVVTRLSPYLESVRSPSDKWDEFCIQSVTESGQWTEHCRGLVTVEKEASANEVVCEAQIQEETTAVSAEIAEIELQCTTKVDMKEFYNHLRAIGLDYGPTFANVRSAMTAPNKCVSTIAIPDTAATMPSGFQYPVTIHPATADSILHGLFAALSHETDPLNSPLLPVSVDELRVTSDLTSKAGHLLNVYTSTERKDRRHIKASMIVQDKSSVDYMPRVIVNGLKCTTLSNNAQTESTNEQSDLAYNVKWVDDVDLLSPEDIFKSCAEHKLTAVEESLIQAQEQAAFYLMDKCLTTFSNEEVSSFSRSHRRFWDCMSDFMSIVRKSQLHIPTEHWLAASKENREQHIGRVSAKGAEGNLLCHVGKSLPAILRKEVEALSVMVEDNRLDAYYKENTRFNRNYQAAARYINLLGYKDPHLAIIEIGAGTGGATLPVLEALGGASEGDVPRFKRLDFTDISSGFFDAAKKKLGAWADFITYHKMDIQVDPLQQGFQEDTYDVVLAANVLHATKSISRTLSHVRKLLKPGGKLLLIELTRERMTTSTIFGTLPGWWAGEDDGRQKGPTLTEGEWDSRLRMSGFSGLDAAVWDSPGECEHQGSMMVSRAIKDEDDSKDEDIILIDHEDSQPFTQLFATKFAYQGVTATAESLTASNPRGKVCVVLCELTKPFLSQMSSDQFKAVKRILTSAKGVIWATQGSHAGTCNPNSSLVTGFSRTVRSEYGASKVITLAVDAHEENAIVTDSIIGLFESHFGRERHFRNSIDSEYVLRDGRLRIPRLISDKEVNDTVRLLTKQPKPELQPFNQPGRPLVIETWTPGLLDSIRFIDDERISETLPDDCVEIEVKATGLNFKDVMMALGQIETETLGLECSGMIKRIGSSVQGHATGDRVACFAFGAFSNFIRSPAIAVQILPDEMTFETAAALPVAYCTAYYSVYHVARVRKGETVLVHAATGGLGQAVLELCQLVGAEIFATVGTIEKKKLLMSRFKLPENHIFYSRDTDFAKSLMIVTGGKGVDVIMNSVAGDMLRVTWECIAPFGRFLELGARDYTVNTRLEMHKFTRNVTFTVVNLVSLVRERPAIAAEVWHDVMALFRTKSLQGPSPLTVFGVSEIEKALRTMQSGKHVGKLVVVARPNDMVKAIPAQLKMTLLKEEASYLIIGGLSGLGQGLARWMFHNGAKNLILTSRRGLPASGTCEAIELLRSQGATIAVYACDISDPSQVSSLLNQASNLPPICGVVQGAMVLKDTFIENMSLADYEAVIRPKVQGTWNIHNQLPKDLDFFLILSSTSGIIGNASQAAYAAASTFLDSFARYRNELGLAASTLDLGVISDIGYVAENQDLGKNLKRQGFEATSVKVLMALVQTAMINSLRAAPRGHIVTGLGTWSEKSLEAFTAPLFSHFRRRALQHRSRSEDPSAVNNQIRDSLRDVKTMTEARSIVCEAIVAKVASLSMIPKEDISDMKPITDYGMDSLVAVELRNWLFKELDVTVTILELLANNPLSSLALKITKRLRVVDPSIPE